MTESKLYAEVDIRDEFDASDSTVRKALSSLEGIIGLKTSCNIDWDSIYYALEATYPDKTTLVPSIVDIIVAWCDVLSTRLEDSRFVAWTKAVTERLEAAGIIRLSIQVAECDRPTTVWSDVEHSFLLSLPIKGYSPALSITSGFEFDFQEFFANRSKSEPFENTSTQAKDNERAEVDGNREAASINENLAGLSIQDQAGKMPSITSVPAPDILFRNLMPYILLVQQRGPNKFIGHGSSSSLNQGSGRSIGQSSTVQSEQGGRTLLIQGTHGPSVQFLYQYLQRWVKKDQQDSRKVPLLRIALHESNFGSSVSHDTLIIEPYDELQRNRGIEMNPTLIWSLIENILGYIGLRGDNGYWEFRRDTPFT